MSWSNVRQGLITLIESVSPDNIRYGSKKFKYLDGQQIEETTLDRCFVVRMTTPPSQVAGVTNGSTWRYTTSCQIIVNYEKTKLISTDEERIAQDSIKIIQALLVPGNWHSDFQSLVSGGSMHVNTDIIEDSERNYLVSFDMTIIHS